LKCGLTHDCSELDRAAELGSSGRIERMSNQTLHDWIHAYNWDDGLAQIWPIIESDETEFATALLIYWRLDGPWFCRDVDPASEAARLHALVESRLRAGRYPKGSSRYDPVADLTVPKELASSFDSVAQAKPARNPVNGVLVGWRGLRTQP
jgi:hypothetical protein